MVRSRSHRGNTSQSPRPIQESVYAVSCPCHLSNYQQAHRCLNLPNVHWGNLPVQRTRLRFVARGVRCLAMSGAPVRDACSMGAQAQPTYAWRQSPHAREQEAGHRVPPGLPVHANHSHERASPCFASARSRIFRWLPYPRLLVLGRPRGLLETVELGEEVVGELGVR